MFRRRDRSPTRVPGWREAFDRTLVLVEAAKASLVSAAPRGRPSRVPLAEALGGFELALRDAEAAMEGWRADEREDLWTSCSLGVAAALERAERLRLEGSPDGYEQLIEELDALLEPLVPFERAAETLKRRPG